MEVMASMCRKVKFKYNSNDNIIEIKAYRKLFLEKEIGFIRGDMLNRTAIRISFFTLCNKKFLGKGYGKKLIEEFMNCCMNDNISTIYVTPKNDLMFDISVTQEYLLNFYKSCGFKEDKKFQNKMRYDISGHD